MANEDQISDAASIPIGAEDTLKGAVSGFLDALRCRGFEAGYYRAIRDVLSDLLLMTEEFIQEHPDAPPELRKLIYSFEELLEKRCCQLPSEIGVVEGGLGI